MATIEVNASSTVCRRCGKAYGRLKGNFSTSYASLYKGTGYLPYCRKCVEEMFDTYLEACKDERTAVRQMCRKLDLYWSEDEFDYVDKKNTTRTMMTSYLQRIAGLKYSGKSYDDTLNEERVSSGPVNDCSENSTIEPYEEIYVDPEIVDFWGADFAPDFLLKLDKRYKDWTEGQDELDKGSISLFKQICILEETIARDAAAGRSVDKNMNTLNTLLGSANLKPVQKKTEADAAMENTPFGVWIDRWEHKRPVPEPDPALRDVDGIIRYITIWFYGHISKTLGIPNMYCEMYEKEMAKMKVDRPEAFDEEVDDDEAIFNAIFGNTEV